MKTHVVPGYVTPEGKVMASPLIIEIDDEGRIAGHRPLDGHEPPFTTPLDALLRLKDLTLKPL